MQALYPINLKLHGKHVLIVGGGGLARQKLRGLASVGASVTVVAPRIAANLADGLPPDFITGRLRLERRPYQTSHLDGMDLVFGATDDPTVNHRVYVEAHARGILANAVDDVDHCDFFTSSVLRRHGVQFTISTDGAFPGLTRALREVLEAWLPDEHGDLIEQLYALRQALQSGPLSPRQRGEVLRDLTRRIASEYLTPATAPVAVSSPTPKDHAPPLTHPRQEQR